MDTSHLSDEIAERIQTRSGQLYDTPTNKLLSLAREAVDAVEVTEPDLTGAQKIVDNAILLAAIGLSLASRAAVAENTMYEKGL